MIYHAALPQIQKIASLSYFLKLAVVAFEFQFSCSLTNEQPTICDSDLLPEMRVSSQAITPIH